MCVRVHFCIGVWVRVGHLKHDDDGNETNGDLPGATQWVMQPVARQCVPTTRAQVNVCRRNTLGAQSYDGSVVEQVRVQESSRQAPVVVFSRSVTVPGIASSPAGAGVFSVHVVTPADDD